MKNLFKPIAIFIFYKSHFDEKKEEEPQGAVAEEPMVETSSTTEGKIEDLPNTEAWDPPEIY